MLSPLQFLFRFCLLDGRASLPPPGKGHGVTCFEKMSPGSLGVPDPPSISSFSPLITCLPFLLCLQRAFSLFKLGRQFHEHGSHSCLDFGQGWRQAVFLFRRALETHALPGRRWLLAWHVPWEWETPCQTAPSLAKMPRACHCPPSHRGTGAQLCL